MKRSLTVFLMMVLVCAGSFSVSPFSIQTAHAADWYNASWSYRVLLTVDADQVDADLTDFPVYVDLSNLPAGFHTHVKSDGGDIRVTQSDGTTEVPREVVFYDAGTDTGELHFKGDLANATDTEFYIYYGNASASDYATGATYGAENVWGTYAAVYHLEEGGTTTASAYSDSSGNNSGGTGVGNVGTDSSSKLGTGTTFDGNADYINIGNGTPLQITGTLSITAWAKPTNFSGYRSIVGKTNSNYPASYDMYIVQSTGVPVLYRGQGSATGLGNLNASTAVSAGAWSHIAVTHTGTSAVHYKNGVSNGSGTLTATMGDSGTNAYIGNRADLVTDFLGSLDEVRIATTTLSAEWIAAEYSNQNSPSAFYTVGSEEEEGGGGVPARVLRLKGGLHLRGGLHLF